MLDCRVLILDFSLTIKRPHPNNLYCGSNQLAFHLSIVFCKDLWQNYHPNCCCNILSTPISRNIRNCEHLEPLLLMTTPSLHLKWISILHHTIPHHHMTYTRIIIPLVATIFQRHVQLWAHGYAPPPQAATYACTTLTDFQFCILKPCWHNTYTNQLGA